MSHIKLGKFLPGAQTGGDPGEVVLAKQVEFSHICVTGLVLSIRKFSRLLDKWLHPGLGQDEPGPESKSALRMMEACQKGAEVKCECRLWIVSIWYMVLFHIFCI